MVRKMIRRSGTFAEFCTQLGADWSFLGHKIECDQTNHGQRHRLNREGRCKSSGLDQSDAVRRRIACCSKKCGKQSICRGGPLAAESEVLAAGAVQGASLDHKDPDLGCQNGLMTTKKCQFYQSKTIDSIVFA